MPKNVYLSKYSLKNSCREKRSYYSYNKRVAYNIHLETITYNAMVFRFADAYTQNV